MANFKELKNKCDQTSRISATAVDEFLLHYAAAKDNLAREFDLRIAPFKHLTRTEAESAWVRILKSQYIIHQVFKEGGLLRKYLNHAEVKRRSHAEQEFLKEQLLVPWRFSFSVISGNPAPDFYQMEDVLSGDSFLLYSKSVTQTLKEQSAILWLNLIAFNGSCWQTFGPLNAYQSFDLDDIFFFATELNPGIDSEESLTLDVEKNPIPYMLLNGAMMPSTVNKDDELLILFSEEERESIDTEKLRADFKVEYSKDVYRFSISTFDNFPHLAAAYFDEHTNRFVVTAMTEKGFGSMIKALNKNDIEIDEEPQIRIHPSMLATTEKILRKKLQLNPYERLFEAESSPVQKVELEKINNFLKSVLPELNSGKMPDIEVLATQAGIDKTFAKELLEDAIAKIESMKKRGGKSR
jgi:hypothetical protein